MLVVRLTFNAITYFTRRFCTSGKYREVQYISFYRYILLREAAALQPSGSTCVPSAPALSGGGITARS